MQHNLILDPLSVVVVLAVNAYKPIGTKLSVVNGKLELHNSSILQGAIRRIHGDSKVNVKLLYQPILYACKQFYSSDKFNPDIEYMFTFVRRGLENLSHTYRDDKEVRTCINTCINVIQSTIDSQSKQKQGDLDFIDMLLSLNRTNVMLSQKNDESLLHGIEDIKNKMIDELHKSWDNNKLAIACGLLRELETATPYCSYYLFNAIDSLLTCIHEKTKEKTDTIFYAESS